MNVSAEFRDLWARASDSENCRGRVLRTFKTSRVLLVQIKRNQ